MGPKQKIVAYIPARGGSKSIPLKNIKTIAGKPLLYWVCNAAFLSKNIDSVYIGTDDKRIETVVKDLMAQHWSGGKVSLIERSAQTATDVASTESALSDFTGRVASDIIVLIQATSPLLTAEDLDSAVELMDKEKADSVVSVVRQKRFIWDWDGKIAKPLNYDPALRPRRQDWDGIMVENGAFYITKTSMFARSGIRLNGKILAWEMAEESYIELDEPIDWEVTSKLLGSRSSLLSSHQRGNVQLVVTDNDGVLTDGGMYYGPTGDMMKKYNAQDGMGVSLLRDAGVEVAIITGENSDIVQRRAEKLGIKYVYLGVSDKKKALEDLWVKTGFDAKSTAYVGDDLNDVAAMAECSVKIAVDNANTSLKNIADYITKKSGGNGAFREAVDWLLETV